MKDLPLISVIMPVYNVEPFLDKCIRSVVEQTYTNLEILLVDDGSPDNCGAICDAWAAKDGRIRVIHKENGGAGLARNVAMDQATGEIFSMVDSDDYLAPTMFEHLYSLMTEDVDIAECALMETYDDHAILEDGTGAEITVCTAEEAMAHHIADTIFRQTPPNKLYRRSVVGDIRFPVGNLIDDEFWTYRVIGNCRRLAASSAKMYAYRQRQGSAMNRSYSLKRLQGLDAQVQRLDYIREKMPRLEYRCRVDLFFRCMFAMENSMLYLDKADRKIAKQKILQVRNSLLPVKCSRENSMKINIWLVLAQLSFEGTCRLQNFLEKVKGN